MSANHQAECSPISLEDQAFDRAHRFVSSKARDASTIQTDGSRLGQSLDVNIYKLTVKDTVEDRESGPRTFSYISGILALQEQKRELAKAALSGKAAKNITKLTLNDLMGERPPILHFTNSLPSQLCSAVAQMRPVMETVTVTRACVLSIDLTLGARSAIVAVTTMYNFLHTVQYDSS